MRRKKYFLVITFTEVITNSKAHGDAHNAVRGRTFKPSIFCHMQFDGFCLFGSTSV